MSSQTFVDVLSLEQSVSTQFDLDQDGQGGGPLVREGLLDGGRHDGRHEILFEGHFQAV